MLARAVLLSSIFSASASRMPVRLGRRTALGLAAGVATTLPPQAANAVAALDGYNPAGAVTAESAGRLYFPPLTPPLFNRATYRYDLGRNAWALEQLLTFAN